MVKTSPPTKKIEEKKRLTFGEAMASVLDGKRVTREQWDDKRWYGLIKDGILHIHKAGESADRLHPWTLNAGDLDGKDWIIL